MAHRLVLALCATALACSSPPAREPVKPTPPADPVAAEAGGDPTASPAAPATPTQPAKSNAEALMEKTLARALEIQGEVARLREIAFKKEVPAERQSRDAFAEVVKRELAKELPAAESKRLSKALFHTGFVADKIDLGAAMELAVTSQVAAYYDPESGKFYAVSLSDDLSWLEVMTAHELTHGLQDQHFDLRKYYGEKPKVELTEDAINARRFIVEGEATFVMMLHAAAMRTKKWDSAQLAKQISMGLGFLLGSMTWQQLVEDSKQQAQKIQGVEKEQLEALDKIPPFILVPMLESYLVGAATVAAVYDKGGWKAVSALYTNPPSSTEQVLHPDKLVGKRDEPRAVELPPLAGATGKPLMDETLGELGWRVYLETWDIKDAKLAAAGWDGDRLAVYQTPAGLVGMAALTFDSTKDAREFEAAFAGSVAARYPGGYTPKSKGAFKRADGGVILVKRRRANVYIVDSSDAGGARELLATVARKTRIK